MLTSSAEPASRHGEFAWLARLAAPERGRLAIACFSMLLTGAAGLVVPRFAGRAVDAVLVERSVSGLRTWIGALVGLVSRVSADIGTIGEALTGRDSSSSGRSG